MSTPIAVPSSSRTRTGILKHTTAYHLPASRLSTAETGRPCSCGLPPRRADRQLPEAGNLQTIPVQSYPGHDREAVEAPSALETGKPGLLAPLHTPKEPLERLVDAFQRAALDGHRYRRHLRDLVPAHSQTLVLILPGHRDTSETPGVAALLQRGVVQLPLRLQDPFKTSPHSRPARQQPEHHLAVRKLTGVPSSCGHARWGLDRHDVLSTFPCKPPSIPRSAGPSYASMDRLQDYPQHGTEDAMTEQPGI